MSWAKWTISFTTERETSFASSTQFMTWTRVRDIVDLNLNRNRKQFLQTTQLKENIYYICTCIKTIYLNSYINIYTGGGGCYKLF